MTMRSKALHVLRSLTPPIAISLMRHLLRNEDGREDEHEHVNVFKGDYDTWEAAKGQSEGYDSTRLLTKIIDANREVVRTGSTRFERDSIIFDTPQTLPSLNSYLLLAYALCNRAGAFTVLDFGGSLGTVYRQFKYVTHGDVPVRWIIVEQPQLVAAGNEEFRTEELSFLESEAWTPSQLDVDVVLISSVLEVISQPMALLSRLKESSASYLLLDRTPMWSGDRDVLTVCIAAKQISGSYPCWLFSEQKLRDLLAADWELVGEWDAMGAPISFARGTATYKGQFWRRRNRSDSIRAP